MDVVVNLKYSREIRFNFVVSDNDGERDICLHIDFGLEKFQGCVKMVHQKYF